MHQHVSSLSSIVAQHILPKIQSIAKHQNANLNELGAGVEEFRNTKECNQDDDITHQTYNKRHIVHDCKPFVHHARCYGFQGLSGCFVNDCNSDEWVVQLIFRIYTNVTKAIQDGIQRPEYEESVPSGIETKQHGEQIQTSQTDCLIGFVVLLLPPKNEKL